MNNDNFRSLNMAEVELILFVLTNDINFYSPVKEKWIAEMQAWLNQKHQLLCVNQNCNFI